MNFLYSKILLDNSLSLFISILSFLVFAVKLPIYGLHFWLPMAHVEAPTFGSMILAGVLLKLGGVSLMRCSYFIEWSFMSKIFLSYFLIFLVYITAVCTLQSDFKRLIAYSSVSHMMVLPLMLFSFSLLSSKAILLVMIFHGMSSPLLFSMVGYSYFMFSTRQFILMRGLVILLPLFSFLMILAFMFTTCIPPFPSFVSEVFLFISIFSYWKWMVGILVVFSFLSLVYNLNWMSLILFASNILQIKKEYSYFSFNFFFMMFMFSFLSVVFMMIFFMI